MRTTRGTRRLRAAPWPAVAAFAALFAAAAALGLGVRTAHAQPGTCSTLVNNLNRTLTGLCRGINSGLACYGLDDITARFRQGQQTTFAAPGNRAQIAAFQTMRTNPAGAALMVSGAGSGRVKLIVFGGGTTTPNANSQGSVFTLTSNNNVPVCERTPSGMLLQTSGPPGTITVNGVRIDLASTAYVVVGGETLFDQDPSIDRRNGRRNPDAPLCSGFDSDCNFGQGSNRCEQGERLVYGPFCDEERYEQIQPGLYIVTLYGRGQVTAGATDYEASGRERFSIGSQRMTLPGSFSFCWEGLQSGGSGFETIVQAESSNARVTHITLQYAGRDCDRSDPESMGSNPNDIGMMTVYNVEGEVGISGDMGSASIPGASRMRVYYDGSRPVDMDPGPSDASYVMGSDAVGYMTFGGADGQGGLPEIVVGGGGTTTPTTSDPVIDLVDVSSPDPEHNDLLRVQAVAYDTAVGSDDGDGVNTVTFRVYDPFENLVLEHEEQNPPFCMLGESSGSDCAVFSPDDYGGVWPEGFDVVEGDYYVEATLLTDAGTEATANSSIYLSPYSAPPATESNPVIDLVDVSSPDPGSNQLLRVQAVAYDAAVGSDNGDGVAEVTFRIYDPSSNLVLEHSEQSTPFCMLGESGSDCAIFNPDDYGGVWPNGYDVVEGDYYVQATVTTDAGTEATADSSIYIAPPGGGGGAASVDDTPPSIDYAYSDPGEIFCYDRTINFEAGVSDDVEVSSVYLRWRAFSDDVGIPDYEWQFMDRTPSPGVYVSSITAPTNLYLDYYIYAEDTSGNVSESESVRLMGNNCDVIVK